MTHTFLLARPTNTLVASLPYMVGHKSTVHIPLRQVADVTSPVASSSLMLIVEATMGAGGVAQPLIMSALDGQLTTQPALMRSPLNEGDCPYHGANL